MASGATLSGRQVDSFEQPLQIGPLDPEPYNCIFIRAPVVIRVGSPVKVLAALEDGRPVAVQQGNVLATSFHPELTSDTRVHQYFVGLVEGGPSTPPPEKGGEPGVSH